MPRSHNQEFSVEGHSFQICKCHIHALIREKRYCNDVGCIFTTFVTTEIFLTGRIKLLRTENNRKRLRIFSFKTERAVVDNCRCKGREAPPLFKSGFAYGQTLLHLCNFYIECRGGLFVQFILFLHNLQAFLHQNTLPE